MATHSDSPATDYPIENSHHPKYRAQHVELYSGVSATVVRDWRRRGLIDEIGQLRNGQWRYSGFDLVALAVTSATSKGAFAPLGVVRDMSFIITDLLIEHVQEEFHTPNVNGRFVWTWASIEPGDTTIAVSNDAAEAMSYCKSGVALCVDLAWIAANLPEPLRLLIKTHFGLLAAPRTGEAA